VLSITLKRCIYSILMMLMMMMRILLKIVKWFMCSSICLPLRLFPALLKDRLLALLDQAAILFSCIPHYSDRVFSLHDDKDPVEKGVVVHG
jgi:hypothetical protein